MKAARWVIATILIMVVENGPGAYDMLEDGGSIYDEYRIGLYDREYRADERSHQGRILRLVQKKNDSFHGTR